MKYAIIHTGKVDNITVCDDTEFANNQGWVSLDGINPEPSIGWNYDGSIFHPPTISPLTLQEAQRTKEVEIRDAAAHQVDLIVKPYYDWEQKSWFEQTSEAEAWAANNMAATPILDAIVSARQVNDPAVTKASIVNNILAKRDIFNAAVGSVIGKQQGLLAKVYATDATVESILGIIW